jgi:hypothetical protein
MASNNISRIISTKLKRKAADEFVIQHFRSRSTCYKKLRSSIIEDDGQFEKLAAAVVCCFPKERKPKGPIEERNSQWWDYGYRNWTNNQFKKRLRVNRETFDDILESMRELLVKETTKFKEPVSPERQLGLTLYRLAHGCSYITVGDLFGIAPCTACKIFNEVVRLIVFVLYDEYVTLPSTEQEWEAELTAFLKDYGFPCVGAWDGFHVYISSNLKNFYSFKKRYSITNMGLVGANKRFLWAGVGAPGSMHDSTLLQSSPIFSEIERGNVLPNKVLILPKYGEIPFAMVGDSAFPARSWLLKAYPDKTKDQKEKYFNIKLRSARVVSEHAYGMLKGRWRITYRKMECRKRNATSVIMACIALHNLCIKRHDPCLPRWQLKVKKLQLIRKPTKRVTDKKLFEKIRVKVTKGLWALRS